MLLNISLGSESLMFLEKINLLITVPLEYTVKLVNN